MRRTVKLICTLGFLSEYSYLAKGSPRPLLLEAVPFRKRCSWGSSSETRQQLQRPESKKSVPQTSATALFPEAANVQRENNRIFGNFHLRCQTYLLCLKSFSKTCLKQTKASSPKFRTTSAWLKKKLKKKFFFWLQHSSKKRDGLLHKAYPFTIHLYKPRTASGLFITWLHSSSIAGNHYHSMVTKNNI